MKKWVLRLSILLIGITIGFCLFLWWYSYDKGRIFNSLGEQKRITKHIGKDFSPYGLGPYPPLPAKWKNREIWPCDSLEEELRWRVYIKLISQGKDPLRCKTHDGMVFPLYPDTVYIKWERLEPDGGYAYNMLADNEPGDRLSAIIKEKVDKVRKNRANDFSFTKDDIPDDLNVLSFEEGGIDPYKFLNLQKPEEVNP